MNQYDRQVKSCLSEEAVEVANELLKNLNPREAMAVLDMAKVLIETYIKS